MKIKVVLLALVMFFGLASGFAGQASADPTPPCDILTVRLEGASDGWFVEAAKCHHGKASREDDVDILLVPVDEGFFGPDCEIVIEKKDGKTLDKNRYLYRVGQGICSIKYKAGKIHVEQKGELSLQYRVQKGSYSEGRGGTVVFNLP